MFIFGVAILIILIGGFNLAWQFWVWSGVCNTVILQTSSVADMSDENVFLRLASSSHISAFQRA